MIMYASTKSDPKIDNSVNNHANNYTFMNSLGVNCGDLMNYYYWIAKCLANTPLCLALDQNPSKLGPILNASKLKYIRWTSITNNMFFMFT